MANNVRALRKARAWTQAELASRAGTTATQISRLEKGERGLDLAWMERLSEALNCPIEHIVQEDLTEEARTGTINAARLGSAINIANSYFRHENIKPKPEHLAEVAAGIYETLLIEGIDGREKPVNPERFYPLLRMAYG